MKKIGGTFNGTGAALYVCCGFIPDKVTLFGVDDATSNIVPIVFWSRHFTGLVSNNGVLIPGDATWSKFTAGLGIEPYEGGDVLTSALQTSVAWGEGVYLTWDRQDYRQSESYGYKSEAIDTWTLGSSGNRTGNFNDDILASGSRIGEGSHILIQESMGGKIKEAVIEVLAASQGGAANEVTLSRAIGSGSVLRIGGMYDMKPVAVAKTTPAGFKLNATSSINVNDEIQAFEAETFDN